jgi:hypothetical protein
MVVRASPGVSVFAAHEVAAFLVVTETLEERLKVCMVQISVRVVSVSERDKVVVLVELRLMQDSHRPLAGAFQPAFDALPTGQRDRF